MVNVFQHGKIGVDRHVPLRGITYERLSSLLDRANFTQSNANLTVYDVQFTYWIFQPSTVAGGSNGPPSKFKGCYPITLAGHSCIYQGEEVKVNCAAFALEVLLFFENNPSAGSARSFHRPKNFWKTKIYDAYVKQLELGWGEMVTPEEIMNYLPLIPDHRIVIIYPDTVSNSRDDMKGPEYVERGKQKILYLVIDRGNSHYSAIKSPRELYRNQYDLPWGLWCYSCSTFHASNNGCKCGIVSKPKKRKLPCEHCKKNTYGNKHHCDFTKCQLCWKIYKNGSRGHRCPVWSNRDASTFLPFIGQPGANPKKSYNLIAWDLESSIVLSEKQMTMGFVEDENFRFIEGVNGPVYYEARLAEHVPNLIVAKNVWTGEQKKYPTVKDFIVDMVKTNKGRNVCYAHNSSGYDSRFVFNTVVKEFGSDVSIHPLMRGSKFLQLTVGIGGERNTIFRDTMLHLQGSLAKLGKDFFKGRTDIVIKKGYFPHLANKEEMYNYVGPIPDKKYFDLLFTLKDEGELEKFNEWYATWLGRVDWYVPIEC
jgi:hypothetical protein